MPAVLLSVPGQKSQDKLYDHQTKTSTGTACDVLPTMEGVKEPLSIGVGNTDALVANNALAQRHCSAPQWPLGAFLAGMIVNQSAYSHRATIETLPMRDTFAVLFFVSIGMLFNPWNFFIEGPPLFST